LLPFTCTVEPWTPVSRAPQLVRQIASLSLGVSGATALPAPLPPPLAAAAPLLATKRRAKRAALTAAGFRTRDFLVGRLAKRSLSLRPAELAVGLALKELRYGHCFDRFAPEACKRLNGSSVPRYPSSGDSAIWRGSISSRRAA
jgi:hypothetical protein